MNYILSLTGKNASRMVQAVLIASGEGWVTDEDLTISRKRNGDEDVVMLECDDRAFFERHMMEACDLLNRDEILASEEDMFLTIGVFGDGSDFSKSMVFSKELLSRLSELKLTLEVNTYG